MEEFWRRNWGYKLVSVLLAILLWLWVSNTDVRAENPLAMPLQEKGLSTNLIVISKLPSTVSVRLQGPVNSAVAKDLVAYVDLSSAVKGENSYPVVVNAPKGSKVLSVDPENITVTVDEIKESSVPVTFVSEGKAAEGYMVGNPIIKPESVTVRGPEQKLAEIAQAYIEVNLANATESITNPFVVKFKDKNGRPIVGPDPLKPILLAQPQTVDVVVPITKKELASRTVPVKASVKGIPGAGFSVGQIISTPDKVTIYGLPEKLEGIDFLNAGIIDVTGAKGDVVNEIKPENLGLPSGVSLQPGIKINIIVELTEAPIEKTLKDIPISVKNLKEGQALLSQSAIDLTIKGPPNVINGLKPSDIILWVDAAGIVPGQNQAVDVYAQMPPGVQAKELPKITLEVK